MMPKDWVEQELRVEMGLTKDEWKKESRAWIGRLLERREAKNMGEYRHSERRSNSIKNKSKFRKK